MTATLDKLPAAGYNLQIANHEDALRLAEKLQHLRALEGELRGLGRPISKTEVVRLMRGELGESLSLPYLSQIETGARPHLTSGSRDLLARFFRVHPGYLVGDPEGFEESLGSPVEAGGPDIGEWLTIRAEQLRADPELYEALLRLASHPDPRALLLAISRALGENRSRYEISGLHSLGSRPGSEPTILG